MKNKEIDWDNAPEGATHYNADCMCPWLRAVPASYFHDGSWIEYKRDDTLREGYFYNGSWVGYRQDDSVWEEHFNNAVKRPQEWDGSGIPPVGTVCEYRLDDGKWFTCKITYTLSGNDDCFVAWCDHLAREQFLKFSSVPYKLYLRKIKTPEQIAAEERSLAIKEMSEVASKRSAKGLTLMESLYDAGYRKT